MTKLPPKKESVMDKDIVDLLGTDIFREMMMNFKINDAINSCSAGKSIQKLYTEYFWKKYLAINYTIVSKPSKYTWLKLAQALGVYITPKVPFGLPKEKLVSDVTTWVTTYIETKRFDLIASGINRGVLTEDEATEDEGFTILFEYVFYLYDLGKIVVAYRIAQDDIYPNMEGGLKLIVLKVDKMIYGLQFTSIFLPPQSYRNIKDNENELGDSLIESLGKIYEAYAFTLDVNIEKEGKSYAELK